MPRALHILTQRPGRTGSGVTLDALVRLAGERGWEQRVVVGTPRQDPNPAVGGLAPEHVRPLVFGGRHVAFDLPGMSDVMPYPSRRFSSLTSFERESYRNAWRNHLSGVLEGFAPDVIHSHHVWLVSSWLKDLAPGVPVVTHCHGTGLRQMELCPELAEEVRRGCARQDAFCVLHPEHHERLGDLLGVPAERIHVVGAGYREEVFHPRGRGESDQPTLVYAGKYSRSKGLPWLLDAVERLAGEDPRVRLHVAGSGSGSEADELRRRMESMADHVVLHGMLSQSELADLLRRSDVFVLPSFYEGLPLVVVEALACGCRAVCTALAGVVSEIAPRVERSLTLVGLPRRIGPDEPDPRDLPAFVDRLTDALRGALGECSRGSLPDLSDFTWSRVTDRVVKVWESLL